jgi:glycosyltransferase involved in cell wall biosynthesis
MNNNEPLISVILPTYNRPEYLISAAQAVTEQTYDSIELIVVDDNSSTPASEVLEDVGLDSLVRLRVVRHETNKGANAARNSGIRKANGEFIAFLDDDDRWEPQKLERQAQEFEDAGSNTGLVYTWIQYVNPDGSNRNTKTPNTRGDVTHALLTGKRVPEFSAVMVRAAVTEQAGLLDERFDSWQDREWYIRLSQHCRFQPVRELLTVRYMGHGDQITDNFERKRDETYPLFIRKHRPLAAEYGTFCERRFIAEHSRILAWSAIRNDHYGEARRLLLRALWYYPLSTESYMNLFASIGGKHTHRLAQRLKRTLTSS